MTGALTPAGLGRAAIVPLMKAGFVDWIVSTGANLYHDLHYGLGMELYAGSPFLNDVELRHDGVIRIYDVLFDYAVLLDTDAFVRQVIQGPEFQRALGTDEFHYLLGKYVYEREKKLGIKETSVLSAGLPVRRAHFHEFAGRLLHRDERGGDGAAGFEAAVRREPRREPVGGHRVRREIRRAGEQRLHPGRGFAEKFHPANGAANPGGDGNRGARARLLPAMHGCAAGHGRAFPARRRRRR